MLITALRIASPLAGFAQIFNKDFIMANLTRYDFESYLGETCGCTAYMEKCNELDLVKHLGIPFFIEGDKMHDWYGPHCSDYHIWLRRIKETFDPENVADSGFYISTEKEKKKKEKK